MSLSHAVSGRAILAAVAAIAATGVVAAQQAPREEGFRFRSSVELINVTATVTDGSGRFVPGLTRNDFRIYDDNVLQAVTHFSNERVPVSLGIAIDTSGSMAGERMAAARAALDRFLFDLLDPEDEIFVYRFSADPVLVHDWTTDRESISRAIRRLSPGGATALYDAAAEAVQKAQTGAHAKKAVVIISDGNDTSSRTGLRAVKQLIRETEVLVYAIAIDGESGGPVMTRGRLPLPIPMPIPRRPGPGRFPLPVPSPGGGSAGRTGDRVNVGALRDLTDDSGGRTELVREARDLDPATAGVADELSRQYYLGYEAPGHADGRWHAIRVEVEGRNYRVRARQGYVASP